MTVKYAICVMMLAFVILEMLLHLRTSLKIRVKLPASTLGGERLSFWIVNKSRFPFTIQDAGLAGTKKASDTKISLSSSELAQVFDGLSDSPTFPLKLNPRRGITPAYTVSWNRFTVDGLGIEPRYIYLKTPNGRYYHLKFRVSRRHKWTFRKQKPTFMAPSKPGQP